MPTPRRPPAVSIEPLVPGSGSRRQRPAPPSGLSTPAPPPAQRPRPGTPRVYWPYGDSIQFFWHKDPTISRSSSFGYSSPSPTRTTDQSNRFLVSKTSCRQVFHIDAILEYRFGLQHLDYRFFVGYTVYDVLPTGQTSNYPLFRFHDASTVTFGSRTADTHAPPTYPHLARQRLRLVRHLIRLPLQVHRPLDRVPHHLHSRNRLMTLANRLTMMTPLTSIPSRGLGHSWKATFLASPALAKGHLLLLLATHSWTFGVVDLLTLEALDVLAGPGDLRMLDSGR
ncbi:hypothetical protein MRX96_046361 [Rhipicephalus microplus]